ncbi:MAG: hypothetical protein ACMXX7_02815 [Candidatus Woesearchaeota archaeon]
MSFWSNIYNKFTKRTDPLNKNEENELFSGVLKRLVKDKATLAKNLYKRKRSAAIILKTLFVLFSQDVQGQIYVHNLESVKNAHIELAVGIEKGKFTKEQEKNKYIMLAKYLVVFEEQIIKDIQELINGRNFISARKNIDLFEGMIEVLHPEDATLRKYATNLREELDTLEAISKENNKEINEALKEIKTNKPELKDIAGVKYLVLTANSKDMQMGINRALADLRIYAQNNNININERVQHRNINRSNRGFEITLAVGLN